MEEPAVYEALAKPLVGHLDPYFIGVWDLVREILRSAFGTGNRLTWAIFGIRSSGMETAIADFVEPDSKFAVLGCGFFENRMAEMGRRQGGRVVSLAEFVQREKPSVAA
jgi:alanine-glyoxylate transaminase / serine-glyoxylate transaminase / serine-pyruvate transaminase